MFDNLPNIMYFGSDKLLSELRGKIFLTPHIGIASLFIQNTSSIKLLRGCSCNIEYMEWDYPNEKLQHPLELVSMTHSLKEITEIEEGISNGYIYKIDISKIKDKLSLFITNDPDREVIYWENKPLNILEVISHTIRWKCQYDKNNAIRHGYEI